MNQKMVAINVTSTNPSGSGDTISKKASTSSQTCPQSHIHQAKSAIGTQTPPQLSSTPPMIHLPVMVNGQSSQFLSPEQSNLGHLQPIHPSSQTEHLSQLHPVVAAAPFHPKRISPTTTIFSASPSAFTPNNHPHDIQVTDSTSSASSPLSDLEATQGMPQQMHHIPMQNHQPEQIMDTSMFQPFAPNMDLNFMQGQYMFDPSFSQGQPPFIIQNSDEQGQEINGVPQQPDPDRWEPQYWQKLDQGHVQVNGDGPIHPHQPQHFPSAPHMEFAPFVHHPQDLNVHNTVEGTNSSSSAINGVQSFPQTPEDEPSLYSRLLAQLEFYFSPGNLTNDAYLTSLMDENMSVPISAVANFNMVKALTNDPDLVVKVMRDSERLVVDDTTGRVRPRVRERNTMILRDIPEDVTEEEIRQALFNSPPSPTSLTREVGGFWYVRFEKEQDAVNMVWEVRTKELRGQKVKARIKNENVVKGVGVSTSSTTSPLEQENAYQTEVYGYLEDPWMIQPHAQIPIIPAPLPQPQQDNEAPTTATTSPESVSGMGFNYEYFDPMAQMGGVMFVPGQATPYGYPQVQQQDFYPGEDVDPSVMYGFEMSQTRPSDQIEGQQEQDGQYQTFAPATASLGVDEQSQQAFAGQSLPYPGYEMQSGTLSSSALLRQPGPNAVAISKPSKKPKSKKEHKSTASSAQSLSTTLTESMEKLGVNAIPFVPGNKKRSPQPDKSTSQKQQSKDKRKKKNQNSASPSVANSPSQGQQAKPFKMSANAPAFEPRKNATKPRSTQPPYHHPHPHHQYPSAATTPRPQTGEKKGWRSAPVSPSKAVLISPPLLDEQEHFPPLPSRAGSVQLDVGAGSPASKSGTATPAAEKEGSLISAPTPTMNRSMSDIVKCLQPGDKFTIQKKTPATTPSAETLDGDEGSQKDGTLKDNVSEDGASTHSSNSKSRKDDRRRNGSAEKKASQGRKSQSAKAPKIDTTNSAETNGIGASMSASITAPAVDNATTPAPVTAPALVSYAQILLRKKEDPKEDEGSTLVRSTIPTGTCGSESAGVPPAAAEAVEA